MPPAQTVRAFFWQAGAGFNVTGHDGIRLQAEGVATADQIHPFLRK